MIAAVDTGGTFTDFCILEDKRIRIFKLPSDKDAPDRVVLEGLKAVLNKNPVVIHGTTVGTNAILEGRGSEVVLITTYGFEDVIEIGRQNRIKLFSLGAEKHFVPVKRENRIGVKERIDKDGNVIIPISDNEIKRIKERLSKMHFDAIAVCLLFSYRNREHEKILKGSLETTDKFLSISTDITRTYGEFTRTSATVLNSYIGPLCRDYFSRLSREIKNLMIMNSEGGTITESTASKYPILTVLSGPVGGVGGALSFLKKLGPLITLDMGGTSTDVSLIVNGATYTNRLRIRGLPLGIETIDIETIGAGGGSIVDFDPAGRIFVGPESMGSDPGPACYNRGGNRVTITDVNLYMKRIPQEGLCGGSFEIFPSHSQRLINKTASTFGIDPISFCNAALSIVNQNMAGAIRRICIRNGVDPASCTLFVYGGASGLHAVSVAEICGIKRVVSPQEPGVFSATGMLVCNRSLGRTVSIFKTIHKSETLSEQVYKMISELKDEITLELAEEDRTNIVWEVVLHMRYRGQESTIPISICQKPAAVFELNYKRYFGYTIDSEIEIANLTVRGTVVESDSKLPQIITDKFDINSENRSHIKRTDMEPERIYRGPLLVVDYSSIFLVPQGYCCRVDKNLLLYVEKSK